MLFRASFVDNSRGLGGVLRAAVPSPRTILFLYPDGNSLAPRYSHGREHYELRLYSPRFRCRPLARSAVEPRQPHTTRPGSRDRRHRERHWSLRAPRGKRLDCADGGGGPRWRGLLRLCQVAGQPRVRRGHAARVAGASARCHPRDPRVDEGRGHVHQAVTGSGHRTEATPPRVTH